MPGEHGIDTGCRCDSCVGYRNDWTVAMNTTAEETVNLTRFAPGPDKMRETPFGAYVRIADVQDLMTRLRIARLS